MQGEGPYTYCGSWSTRQRTTLLWHGKRMCNMTVEMLEITLHGGVDVGGKMMRAFEGMKDLVTFCK